MIQYEREKLIEDIGVIATDKIKELEEDLAALTACLGLVKVYRTKGIEFRKENQASPFPETGCIGYE